MKFPSKIDMMILLYVFREESNEVKNARIITEGAISVAIFTVFLLFTLYTPVISVVGLLFLPLPFMLYSQKFAHRDAVVMSLVGIGISFLFGGLPGLGFGVLGASLGTAIGWALKSDLQKTHILLLGTLVTTINAVVAYVISIKLLGMNVIKESLDMAKTLAHQNYTTMTDLGFIQPDEKKLEQMDAVLKLLNVTTPATFAIGSALYTFLILAISFPLMKRLGRNVPSFLRFREWKFPKSILWYYILLFVLSLIIQPESGSFTFSAIINVQIILGMLFTIQGLSFLYFFGHMKNWSKGLMAVVTIISIPLLSLVRILGIIDLGFDLRERLKNKS